MATPFQLARDSYMTQVVPATAGPVQRYETLLAFYAGAMSVLRVIAQLDAEGIDGTAFDDAITALVKEVQDGAVAAAGVSPPKDDPTDHV